MINSVDTESLRNVTAHESSDCAEKEKKIETSKSSTPTKAKANRGTTYNEQHHFKRTRQDQFISTLMDISRQMESPNDILIIDETKDDEEEKKKSRKKIAAAVFFIGLAVQIMYLVLRNVSSTEDTVTLSATSNLDGENNNETAVVDETVTDLLLLILRTAADLAS